ncbi:GAP family protein [Actinoplanes sp. M2I2]|uniref:GAP family protein n=1 Tax=Actinoplanes sp. M2I2 TaxID=1734444 RepID=UPI002020F9A9|nr:GAP family protein [Actinoplanes sp. M2I2]
MTAALLAGVAGLALLDALNPATIAGVALLLLAPMAHPVRAAAGFVAGAYLTVFALGAVVYAGADAAADAVGNGLVWLRRTAFTVAAVALAVAGLRRLRTRIRPAVTVPRWVNPLTAAGLGLLMTGADLPNAFPYFIAIERIVGADVGTAASLAVIAGYALVYCLPCLLLLLAGAARGDRVRRRLGVLYERLGAEKKQPRSVPIAAGHLVVAAGVLAVAVLA